MRVFQIYKQCRFTAEDWDLTEKEGLEGIYDEDRVAVGKAMTAAFNSALSQGKAKDQIYADVMSVAEKIGYGATDSTVEGILRSELNFVFARNRDNDIDVDLSEPHQFLFSNVVCKIIGRPTHRMSVKLVIELLYNASKDRLDAKILIHDYISVLREEPSLAIETYFTEIIDQDLEHIFYY